MPARTPDFSYDYERLRDGQEVPVGPYRLRVLATPGHTPEHVCYLLVDQDGSPRTLFAGGSLMVGTAARPDLLGPADSWRLAAALHRTMRERLLTLPDYVDVLPTHGAGSFCAAEPGGERTTTIARERAGNRLAAATGDGGFIALALSQGPYPGYFDRMRALNQHGAPLLGRRPPTALRIGLEQFDAWLAQGAAILDLRSAAAFCDGHLPGIYAVGVGESHSTWVGWLLRPNLMTAAADASDPSWRATGLGVYRFWRDGGYAIGALFLGLVANGVGLAASYYGVAAAMGASAVVLIALMTETHPRRTRPDDGGGAHV